MDIQAKLKQAQYKCSHGKDIYNAADDVGEQERGLSLHEEGMKIYQMLLSAGAPQFMKASINDQYNKEKEAHDDMASRKGKIAMAQGGKGGKGGGGKGDNDEKDEIKNKMAEVIVKEKPDVAWDDVAGQEGAKDRLKQAVIEPIMFPNFFVGNVVSANELICINF